MLLVPQRRRGLEVLDAPDVSPWLRNRSLRDITVANRLFGGTRAVLHALEPLLARLPAHASLLDVGTGLGDIPARAQACAARRGIALDVLGVDAAESLAGDCRAATGARVACGDARALPFADASVDVVTCSQVLHHFDDDEVPLVLAELDRVARVAVIVSDLRRSWLAAGGFWAASWPLGFHAVSRHDGVLSVLRGFTPAELGARVHDATGARATVRGHLGWRVTACWTPAARPASRVPDETLARTP